MLIILTGLWLVSCLVAIVTWTRTALRGRGWIETQKKRGENGVLRLIALQKFNLAVMAVVIALLMLAVVGTLLIPIGIRPLFSRTVLMLIVTLFGYMGWLFDRQSHRIMDKIRAEVLREQAAEVD